MDDDAKTIKLKTILAFYADEESYKLRRKDRNDGTSEFYSDIEKDKGKLARDILLEDEWTWKTEQ